MVKFFKEQTAKAGRIGGKRPSKRMMAEQRAARAKRASKALAEARRAKAPKSKGH